MTRGLENAINRYMYSSENDRIFVSSKSNYEDQFSIFFIIDVSNLERIECPIFMIKHLIETLQDTTRNNIHINRIVVPAEVVRHPYIYKTIDSLFKDMFEAGPLQLVKLNFKDNTVYGNRGVIINKIHQLLYCETLLLDCLNSRVLEENVYIHPEVYRNNKNVINKGIISRFMPLYIGQKRDVDFDTSRLGFSRDNKISSNVIFKEFPILQTKKNFMSFQNNATEILQKQIQTLQNSMRYV